MNDITKQAVSYIDKLLNVKKNSQTLAAARPAVRETLSDSTMRLEPRAPSAGVPRS
jgi:hypothetical protein